MSAVQAAFQFPQTVVAVGETYAENEMETTVIVPQRSSSGVTAASGVKVHTENF